MAAHTRYTAAANACLRLAIRLRDEAAAHTSPTCRRADRRVMREYALEWRMFRAHARRALSAAQPHAFVV